MQAKLGRCRRLDKFYSRARDRSELVREIDDALHGDVRLPAHEDTESAEPLARLMQADATYARDPQRDG